MTLSEEMQKMIEVVEKYDGQLQGKASYKRYFAPDIPEKVVEKLFKFFDSHLIPDDIIAFYDGTLFSTGKEGIVFTCDGICFKDLWTKPVYIQYIDIDDCIALKNSLEIYLKNCEELKYSHIGPFDYDSLKGVIQELKRIDEEYGQTSFRASGQTKKINIPKNMMDKCQMTIHSAAVMCGGVGTGLAQIPASDSAVLVPIQIGMITELGAIFDLDISEAGAKGIITSAGAAAAGRTISQFLVGWIPGVGNAINTATAAGITEAIGWIAVRHFYDRWMEDQNKGRLEGMKDGYARASAEYEQKLKKQAEEFLNQKKDAQRECDAYENLLEEYETYIKELEERLASTEKLEEVRAIYQDLCELRTA